MRFITSLVAFLLCIQYAYSVDYQFATCIFGDFGYFNKKDTMIEGGIQIFKKIDNSSTIQFFFDVNGLRNRTYAVQVLEYGLHTNNNLNNLGGVFNPEKLENGACPSSGNPRVGDIGNLVVVDGEIQTPLISLTKPSIGNDINSIIGRSIALYEDSYKCDSTNFDFNVAQLVNYCTIGVGNLSFVDNTANVFDVQIDTKVDVNTARSYSELGNDILAVVEVYNTSVVPEYIEGKVFFKNINDTFVQINSEIQGLSYQAHGFHIHQFGERSDMTGYAIGGHWFESGQTHALPENKTRHFGDMGNFCAFNYDMTSGYYHYETDYFKVADLLGRGMAVHNNTDNGVEAGGARVAQGVIALVSPNSGEVVQLPNEDWVYDIICPNGAYKGGASSYNDPSDYPTGDPSSASTTSSFIALIIISIISTFLF